jgi:cytochrome b subunit of formate dehydrogenase
MKIISANILTLLAGLMFLPANGLQAQSRADCLMCHSDSTLSIDRAGKKMSLFCNEADLNSSVHKGLTCVACHAGFKPDEMPHKSNITPVNCLTCHATAPFDHKFHPQIAAAKAGAVAPDASPDIDCKYCHGTHNIGSPKVASSKTNEAHIVELCTECHGDVGQDYAASAHGKAHGAGIAAAPTCLTCHRQPIVGMDSPQDSLAVKTAQVKLCLSCHLDDPNVKARMSPTAGFIASYENSVHGSALAKGNSRAANCVDCHGSHQMNKGVDTASMMSRANIPATCGKCHAAIANEYEASVHGTALAKGNPDAPVCTNCHGEHDIMKHDDPNSPVANDNLAAQVCAKCHGSVELSKKYGMASDRVSTFADSYHGLAVRGGSATVANCASCHTAHNIRPSSDPLSSVNMANLMQTCGKCHPNITTNFAAGSVHVALAATKEPTLYWLSTGYLILIILTIGGMFAHNVIDFIKRSEHKLKVRRGILVLEQSDALGTYLRMSSNERCQHALLFTSFILLVITGFMLRYPDAWWVVGIRSLSDRVFELRSIIHRVAAVVMVSVGCYHIYYLTQTERGRQLLRDLMPTLKDGQDIKGMMRYYLGLTHEKPKFGRFGYVEKSEYWALVWGTVVMGTTGVVMWFDNTFISIFSKYGYDISRTIHFYEAWLAMLAIIVWHFYAVIFNPDIYPMNVAWFKGTISRAEMEEEHPLELEEILRKQLEDAAKEEEQQNGQSSSPQPAREISKEQKDPDKE